MVALAGAAFRLAARTYGIAKHHGPRAKLRGAFLMFARLRGAEISGADLRGANLCGADLRGANVEGVDFYLVDLRDAQYTQDQAEHFARCGAILRSRVA